MPLFGVLLSRHLHRRYNALLSLVLHAWLLQLPPLRSVRLLPPHADFEELLLGIPARTAPVLCVLRRMFMGAADSFGYNNSSNNSNSSSSSDINSVRRSGVCVSAEREKDPACVCGIHRGWRFAEDEDTRFLLQQIECARYASDSTEREREIKKNNNDSSYSEGDNRVTNEEQNTLEFPSLDTLLNIPPIISYDTCTDQTLIRVHPNELSLSSSSSSSSDIYSSTPEAHVAENARLRVSELQRWDTRVCAHAEFALIQRLRGTLPQPLKHLVQHYRFPQAVSNMSHTLFSFSADNSPANNSNSSSNTKDRALSEGLTVEQLQTLHVLMQSQTLQKTPSVPMTPNLVAFASFLAHTLVQRRPHASFALLGMLLRVACFARETLAFIRAPLFERKNEEKEKEEKDNNNNNNNDNENEKENETET